jgi:hypothetical protein
MATNLSIIYNNKTTNTYVEHFRYLCGLKRNDGIHVKLSPGQTYMSKATLKNNKTLLAFGLCLRKKHNVLRLQRTLFGTKS